MTMSDERQVAQANDGFYRAFESLDRARMESVWLRSERTQCTHPGWTRLRGFERILASWEGIFANTPSIHVELTRVSIQVMGDLAWVACTENLKARPGAGAPLARVEATNVFERHEGRWLMVLHHGSPVQQPPDETGPEEPFLH